MIYIGLCSGDILMNEAIDYAMEQVEMGDNRSEMFELAGAYADDFDYIVGLVQDLQEDFLNAEIENRKIRLAIVYDAIKEKNQEFVEGLIELTELWAKLGFPDDSPHIIQGRNNSISPSEYYSQENYDKLYRINCDWFDKELEYLQNFESSVVSVEGRSHPRQPPRTFPEARA